MSNLFNSTRFFGLIRRQWIGFGRIYLMSIGIMAGVIFGFYAVNIGSNYDSMKHNFFPVHSLLNFRAPLFCILGLFFVTVISSSYFADLGRKTRAIFELMIPASQLEKFVVGIFYTVIVSIGSYLLIYYVIDFAFVSYVRSFGLAVKTEVGVNGNQVTVDDWPYFFKVDYPRAAYYFCLLPLLLNAIFLMGSIIFQSYQYIKTAVALVVYCVVWMSLFVFLMKTLTENTTGNMENNYWSDSNHIFGLIAAAGALLTLIFWFIAFLRLKEKEI
ncbi:hypothetical protein HX021_01025 [Sphingobacterium sp. N143]|uniref:hypothetical protein n=1 Tax=Sphingobacterium sp. N143 TaxID=2746727 RepID=UPI002575C454|nr:hypothetical protein [Sphingobacterium sp. N143]MDM1292875.1 hypothetical protein [Sphingobacterium sp. N143]